MASDSKNAPKRTWRKPEVDAEERHRSGEEFTIAAMKYLTQFRPSEEWTKAETLAVRLVSELRLLFLQGAPDPDGIEILRRALHAFRKPIPVIDARVYCVRAITQWGRRWKQTTAEAEKSWILTALARELSVHDDAFDVLTEHPEELACKLDRFEENSSGKNGAAGAARILAELIYEGQDALGLSPPDDMADEDAIEWLRARIAKAVSNYFSIAELPEK